MRPDSLGQDVDGLGVAVEQLQEPGRRQHGRGIPGPQREGLGAAARASS